MNDYTFYRRCVRDLRTFGMKNELSADEIDEIFEQCFKELDKKYSTVKNKIIRLIKIIIFTVTLIVFSIIVVYNHPSTHKLFLRNMQNLIYPGFNIVRKLAVPIITKYPRLTELYDESCLVENPLFYVPEMDCWPCNAIQSVPDLTGINVTKNFNTGIPFTRLENGIKTDMIDIVKTCFDHQEIFNSDALRVTSNNLEYRTISDVINKRLNKYPSNLKNTHISWRITRVKPGRILRKLFPKLSGTPDWWSQSVERYLLVDEPNASIYNLPNPECSNVILRATSGKRLIKLIPSPECQHNCRANAVVLSAGYSLWYNWWYWRPVSQPVINSTEISVQYLTSFC